MASSQSLEETLQRFNEHRQQMMQIYDQTGQTIENMSRDFTDSQFLDKFMTAVTGTDDSKFGWLRKDFNSKPSLLVVGQLKSGKSTLINELLGSTVVEQCATPCTARITTLTFSEKNYLQVKSAQGEIKLQIDLQKLSIPRQYVNIDPESRDQDCVLDQVVAGLNIELLKSGLNLVDSPGRNENPKLDEITMNVFTSLLPIVLYVIDGRDLVKSKDVEDIGKIKKMSPFIRILFVVTKLDPDSTDPDHKDVEHQKSVAENKMKRVHQRLVREGFLTTEETWETCADLIGLSLSEVKKWRRQNAKMEKNHNQKLAPNHWMEGFQKFRSILQEFISDSLSERVKDTAVVLQNVYSRILNIFLCRAKDLKAHKQKTQRAFEFVTTIEGKLNEKTKQIIGEHKTKLAKDIIDRVKVCRKDIVAAAIETTYDEVDEKTIQQLAAGITDPELELRCLDAIYETVRRKIHVEIKVVVQDFLKHHTETIQKLLEIIEADLRDDLQQGAAYNALRQSMVIEYEIADVLQFTTKPKMHAKLKQKMHGARNFFKKPMRAMSGAVPVGKASWKENKAKEILDNMDKKTLADSLHEDMSSFFEQAHIRFRQALRNDESLLEKVVVMTEQERIRIVDHTPHISNFYMQLFNIISEYNFQNVSIIEPIGRGAQGDVYSVRLQDGQQMAMKTVRVDEHDPRPMTDLAMEIYNSTQYRHPCLLPILGMNIRPIRDSYAKEIRFFVPLRDTDGCKFLATRLARDSKKLRLQVALKVAEALDYLHEQFLMHRDVKLENVLLNKDGTDPCLCDFGLSKPFGLHEASMVGTPSHMAPEVWNGQEYDYKADCFSFAVMLWCLYEGKGYPPPKRTHSNQNVRPPMDKLDNCPADLQQLMENGWSKHPDKRPTMHEMHETLKNILDKMRDDL